MKASSHPTGKGPSGSKRLQLGGVPLRVAVGKICTKDVECHTPKVLLQLKHLVIFSIRRVFGQTSFNEPFLFNSLQFKVKFTHLSTLGLVKDEVLTDIHYQHLQNPVRSRMKP